MLTLVLNTGAKSAAFVLARKARPTGVPLDVIKSVNDQTGSSQARCVMPANVQRGSLNDSADLGPARSREVIYRGACGERAKVHGEGPLLGGALGERSSSRSTSNCAMRRTDISRIVVRILFSQCFVEERRWKYDALQFALGESRIMPFLNIPIVNLFLTGIRISSV